MLCTTCSNEVGRLNALVFGLLEVMTRLCVVGDVAATKAILGQRRGVICGIGSEAARQDIRVAGVIGREAMEV